MTRHRIFGVLALFGCMLFAWPSLAQQSRELWVTRHDGPVSGNDSASAIAVGSTGNSYVTGQVCAARDWTGQCWYGWETVKYDTNGVALWTARFPEGDPFNGDPFNGPAAIAVDASGNVYVTGSMGTGSACDELGCYSSYSDYATVKYGPNGAQLWLARYNGSGSYYGFGADGAAAVAVDSSGNVYVTGTSYGADFLPHYATLKYDANGNTIWVARYNGPGNGSDYAQAIGVDSSGNVYITGGSTGVTASLDYATIKYDSAGNQLWVARYDGPASGDDFAVALAVGTSGSVYVTGFSGGIGTSDDYATIKYDSTGNQLWLARYDGPAHGMDRTTAIALDSNENVHVTGYSSGASLDYATLKYDSNGNQIWVARYDGPAHGSDRAHSIVVDAFGRVNVTGESVGIGTGFDYATIQYSPQGAVNWVDRYDGPGHGDDFAVAIAVDSSGNAYVTGSSFDPVTNFDWATLKLSAVAPAAAVLSVSLNSVTFANQLLKTTSAEQVIAVSNSGSTPIQITGITTAGDFAQTNNCGAAVAPNSVCNVYVTFTPSATGTRTGSMTVNATQ
jgi:hypothetical protein